MALSTWDITRSSLILWEGDSLADPALPYQMLQPLWEQMRMAFNPTYATGLNGAVAGGLTGTVRTPGIVNKSVNGAKISDVNGRIAAELAANAFTHVVLCIGTNERAVVRATTQSDIASLVSKFTTQKVLVIGPYAWGEKTPTGQNGLAGANDQRLDETEVDLKNGFASYANSMVIGLRNGGGSTPTTGLYLTTLAALNAPGNGSDTGPFTIDGIHWNTTGRARACDIVRPFVTFG